MIQVVQFGEVAHISFRNPPVNALSVGNGLVSALGDAVRHALADSTVKAVVIASEGKYFSAGADLIDFDRQGDTLERSRHLTSNIIEDAAKPVVIAVQGLALGGGLELALAGHYRISTRDAEFGLPEVRLGLLPGGGGTQRLPRLVGTTFALEMMQGGKTIGARDALKIGLIDRIAENDLAKESVEFASASAAEGPRPTKNMQVADDTANPLLSEPKRGPSEAQSFIARCVEAARTKPFAEGMALEGRLFEQLRTSETSRGLRHVFLGRREVSHIPGIKKNVLGRPIRSVAVVGSGLMGTGITTALINAGLKVDLIESDNATGQKALDAIKAALDRDVSKGRLSSTSASERFALVSLSRTIESIANADLVIEAVFEDMEVKCNVFADLDRIAKPQAILATNTSTLDLDAIAEATARPDRVVGLHFFSPANIMKLVEVVRGAKTSNETLEAAMAFTKAIGKVGVVAGVCDGFIGNRMFEEYLRQAYFLLEEGALPTQIDAALEAFGMAMGPLKVMDLAGQDIGWNIRKRRAVDQPDRPYSKIPDLICELGRFGQKTGSGFYLYPDGRRAEPDPFIEALITGYSESLGAERRVIGDEEIVERCVLALVNEGAKLLAERIAYRPTDIDMVYVFGYGFPETKGGPMFFADHLGLDRVLARIEHFRNQANGWAWEPAPLLVTLARRGLDFDACDLHND